MGAYIVKRLLWMIPTFLGAVTLIFFVMRVLPGDIAQLMMGGADTLTDPVALQAMREKLGLNLPLWQQYINWLGGLLRLDLGTSLWTGKSVWYEISVRLPYTLTLGTIAMAFSIVLSIPIGIISALKQDTWIDHGLRSFAILGLSIPNFWLAMLILLVLLNVFKWSPPLEYYTIVSNPGGALQQLLLPALCVGFRQLSVGARMMRSSMLEVLGEDYIRTARAKGLRERIVIYLHGLRNAILPVVTIIGMEVVMVVAGAVIVETIFSIPGVGRLLVDAINNRDVVMVQGVVSVIVAFILVINMLVDLLYGWIDPRVRYD